MAITARLEMYWWTYSWALRYQTYYHALYSSTVQSGAYHETSATWQKTVQYTDYWQSVNGRNYDKTFDSITWPSITGGPQNYYTSLQTNTTTQDMRWDNGTSVYSQAGTGWGYSEEMKPYAERTIWQATRFNTAGDTFEHRSEAKYRFWLDGGKAEPIYKVKVWVTASTTDSRSGGFRNSSRRTIPYNQIFINRWIPQSMTGALLSGCTGGATPNYFTISTPEPVAFYDKIGLTFIG